MIDLKGRIDPVKTLHGTMKAVAGDVYDVPPAYIKPTLQAKTAKPTSENQRIVPDDGYDGLSSVSIEAVALQAKSATPTTEDQYIQPDNGYTGLSIVEVKKVSFQEKEATPGNADQTVTADDEYTGLSSVTVKGSANLLPENIKKDVTIFGVVGEHEGVVKATAVSFFKSGNTVTETSTLEDGTTASSVISLDENGVPVSVSGSRSTAYSYSGSNYPDINTVWTDKNTYPYAVIYRESYNRITLFLLKEALVMSAESFGYSSGQAVAVAYRLTYDGWALQGNATEYTFLAEYISWTSHDIYYGAATDPDYADYVGTLFRGTTDPVPADEWSVSYNLADFSGSYIARETWTGTSDSDDGCEYEHVNFGVGEFPLTMVTYSNFAGSTNATEGNATNFSLQGFKPKKGQRVEIKYYFPEIELSYASQCTNLVIERNFEIFGNNANLFINIMDNGVEVSDGYYQGLFDDYTLTPITQDGTCVGFTFTGTLATDVESESKIYFGTWYGYDALPDGPVGSTTISHHNDYSTFSIKVTQTSQKEVVDIDIEYGADGYPSAVTIDGEECPVSWEGFE